LEERILPHDEEKGIKMENLYRKQIDFLLTVEDGASPCVSMFLPILWVETEPAAIFRGLVESANRLLRKDGFPSLSLSEPEWENWKDEGAVTLGLFIKNELTIIVPLPLKLQPRVIVAQSFHIKPLIASESSSRDSLMLYLDEQGAKLYRVGVLEEKLLKVITPLVAKFHADWQKQLNRFQLTDILYEIKDHVQEFRRTSTIMLGIAGATAPLLELSGFWSSTGLIIKYIPDVPGLNSPLNAISMLRLTLAQDIALNYRNSVDYMLETQELNPDLKELPRLIKDKQISRLCVSLEDLMFGEIGPAEVQLHRHQQNTKDDDVLDDLIEMAIKSGVSVNVVPKKFLPQGKVFLVN
jgi:hypothetical protein